MHALKLVISLSKLVGEPKITEYFMNIWYHTDKKINLPFPWIWSQYRKVQSQSLSDTVYLESDEILGNTMTAADIIMVVNDIDRIILERTHEMIAKAKIDIDVASLQMAETI